MVAKEIAYSNVGVNRQLRASSKKALQILKDTYQFSFYGEILQLPFGNILPLGKDQYLDLQIEGVGTKVLLAQLAGKYDTVGVDGVAMVVNDVIRSGAKPLAIADNIHAQISDPVLIGELMKGIVRGATRASCVVPNGEIGDVNELIKGLIEGKGFDMIVAAVGKVTKEEVISGRNIEPDDIIIGLRSSGIHSNGISLARKILFKQWGGRFETHDVPDGLDVELIREILKPTEIYVKQLLKVAEEIEIKAAIHITGDGYLKFARLTKFSRGIGFEFDNFNPQPIFGVIQKTALELGGVITDEEMFKTFNMGWGFALIVDKTDADKAMDIIEKSRIRSEPIGKITRSRRIKVLHNNKKIILK